MAHNAPMRQEIVSETLDLSALPAHRALAVRITAAGIRQYQVAERIGKTEAQLSRILAGRGPLSEELAAQIASAIDELAPKTGPATTDLSA